jgi:hypothetical protein
MESADMTKDEALKLALEALENISTALREDDVLGSDIELMLDAITTIRETLAQPDEDAIIIRYHEMTIKRLEKRIEELTAQPVQEPVAYIDVEQRRLQWAKPMSWNTPTTVNLPKIPLYTAPVQPEERNFCPRCGKRTADLTTIHTCTPPRENT